MKLAGCFVFWLFIQFISFQVRCNGFITFITDFLNVLIECFFYFTCPFSCVVVVITLSLFVSVGKFHQ